MSYNNFRKLKFTKYVVYKTGVLFDTQNFYKFN